MGANILGYTLIRPIKGHEELAEKQLSSIKKILESKENSQAKIKALGEIDVSIDNEELSDNEYLEAVSDRVNQIEQSGFDIESRDLASRNATVKGVDIEILFAGDSTWGDEPNGYAYGILKTLVELGISDKWENAIK